jgi:hypothetical protein
MLLPETKMRTLCGAAAAALLTLPAVAEADLPVVVYSTIPTHDSSLLPGSTTERITNLNFPFRSDNGQYWVTRFQTDASTTNGQNQVFVRTGPSGGQAMLRGNTAVPGLGTELFSTLEPQVRINDIGEIAFSFRSRPGTTGAAAYNVGRLDSSGAFSLVARTGEAVPQITGASYGRVTDANILNDGRIGFQSTHMTGVDQWTEQAVFLGDQLVARKAFTIPTGQSGGQTTPYGGPNLFQGFNSLYLQFTPDGGHWLTGGKVDRLDEGGTNQVYGIVVDNHMVMEEDLPILGTPGTKLQELNAYPTLGPDGTWYARVFDQNPANRFDVLDHFLVRDGEILHRNGTDVPGGEPGEHFARIATNNANVFFNIQGNAAGDFYFGAATDHADPFLRQVIVLNNEEVILRSGDEVDLDGDGLGDDLFIHAFGESAIDGSHFYNTGFLTDDGLMTLRVMLRDEAIPAGTANIVGQAYITYQIPEPASAVAAVGLLGGCLLRRRR